MTPTFRQITSSESPPKKIELDKTTTLEQLYPILERLIDRVYILEMHLYHAGIVRYTNYFGETKE